MFARAARNHPLPIGGKESKITIEKILCEVSRFYDVRIVDIKSERRTLDLIRPRHVACYLARKHTSLTTSKIGRLIGDRDHTTAMHAINSIKGFLATGDAEVAYDIEMLNEILNDDRTDL
jgi:chromosomal replication initiator protein